MQITTVTQHRINTLNKKYSKKREINPKVFKEQTPWQKTGSIIFDIFCVVLVLFMGVFCFSILNSKYQRTPASVFGYYALKIASPSMEASGFKVGDCVMVGANAVVNQNVDSDRIVFGNPLTLKENHHKIATTASRDFEQLFVALYPQFEKYLK